MDPNHWNYNQYSRLAQGSLSTPHAAFPLLDQAGLSSSLGLTHSLQPHAPLAQRPLSTIPAVNYAAAHHPLHSTAMSQIIESMSPLASSFNAQSLHKAGMSLSQNPLVFESVRNEQQIPASSARFSPGSTAVFSPSKPSLFEDQHKDPPHTYSSPSVVSQSPALESSSKGWGLSNFMPPHPPTSNPFGAISDLSNTLPMSSVSHRSSQPPPAHSSASRHSAIQRNPFSTDGITSEVPSRSGRSEVPISSAQAHSLYNMMGISRQHSHSTPTPSQTPQSQQMEFHSMTSHEIEDLSSGSQSQNQLYYSIATTSYTSSAPTNTTSFAASQLTAADINYDPVSPATPLSENQTGDSSFPTTVSFADLNAIGASSHHPQTGSKSRGNNLHSGGPPSLALPEPKEVPQHLHSLMMPQPASRGRGSKSQVQQISASVNSPHQHSPISVGSPQTPMSSMGSPQNVMPSSTVKPAAPPVQAMADSSTATKPKKPRSRKKPKAEILKTVPPPQPSFGNSQQPGFLSSSQQFSSGNNNFQTPTSRAVQQFQQHQDNQSLMQTQFGNSASSPSPQNLMRMRAGMAENMSSEGGYQVLSSVSNNQVSPISDQSPRSQPQQPVEQTPAMMPLPNSRVASSPAKAGSTEPPLLSGAYQDDQDLIPQQTAQFDLQAFSQPYMEQLVSGQPVRLIPGNVYSEAMHVASGMSVFPAPFAYQTAEGSTIDEAAFSSLFDTSANTNNKAESQAGVVMENAVVEMEPPQAVTPVKQSATCTNPVDEDDELCNFARPPPELADKDRPAVRQAPPQQNNPLPPVAVASAAAVITEKPEAKAPVVNKTGPGFQDSFLNFLMGKKQETLSSVTSATIGEKPQLPKYIPEPRRPAPPPKPPEPAPSSTPLSFSEDEEDSNMGAAVKNAISTLGNDSDSYDSEVLETGYSVQRTKDLTVKITLQNTLKKQHRSRGRPPRPGRGASTGRGRGDNAKSKSSREPTPPPPRESIGRRAKDAAKEKTKKKKKYRESDSSGADDTDEEFKPTKGRPGGSGSEYDSDKDPVWTPFEEEAKRPVGFTFDASAIIEAKPKKGRSKSKRHRKGSHKHSGETAKDVPAAKVARTDSVSPQKSSTNGGGRTVHTLPVEDQVDSIEDENFQVGRFLLEKKDLHNYESYPIWRLEQGRMMRKFEMIIENGHIHHKAVSTYSSWVPSMRAGYIPIRVLVITNKPHGEVVEVMEECRPKPPADGSLEVQYEDDPLVDHFNVYLQIFLSQSLESSFLAAIRKSQEYFYLVPLEKIDKMIEHKLEQIDKIVQWKPKFRECMRTKPQMREINRPNLKQSCQACENSSPPTIKSVLFHGAAYDRFLLGDLPNSDSSSQEFLVGKTAAPFVTQYHNLQHFKYRLYQRCRAKVHMVRESNKSQNIKEESILDQCLQNRGWVLKIFEDFKALLER